MACQVKKDTPTIYLNELTNAKSMQQRLDIARIKLWHKYKRAPIGTMKNFTFNNWKNYILNNGGNINDCKKLRNKQIGRDEYFRLDTKTFNFISKSPLSQSYLLMDLLLPVECKIFSARAPDILKPVPTYRIPYPNNIRINRKTTTQQADIFSNTNTNTELWNFYTDGSCLPNPGPATGLALEKRAVPDAALPLGAKPYAPGRTQRAKVTELITFIFVCVMLILSQKCSRYYSCNSK